MNDATVKKKVMVFGRGNMYLRKKERLFREYDVVCFLDNSVSHKETDEETEIDVYPPRAACDFSDAAVIVMSNAAGQMVKQLCELGVKQERMIFGAETEPFNSLEKSLFSDHNGRLIIRDDGVYYENKKHGLLIRTDEANLELIDEQIRDTGLFEKSDDLLSAMRTYPLDDTYGIHRGTPVDRYYIEKFMEENSRYISGNVLEVGDRRYTEMFGAGKVGDSKVLHVDHEDASDGVIKGNLETGDGLPRGCMDCFICTQTLQFIYDSRKAAENAVGILKPGGVALLTVSGISQIIRFEMIKYGHFWSFTDMSLKRLFEDVPGCEVTDIRVFGNVKSASAFLYGISREELSTDDLDYADPAYQVIIGAVIERTR